MFGEDFSPGEADKPLRPKKVQRVEKEIRTKFYTIRVFPRGKGDG